jgi:ribosomal-protein-alanine N-acetyltransferase
MIEIREMTLEDIPKILLIEEESFLTPWSREAFFEELNINPLARYFVGVCEEGIFGYIGMWLILDEAHITNIAVGKAFRGRGYGGTLLEEAMGSAREMGAKAFTLEVRESNFPAINLYTRMGFKVGGRRKNYYQDSQEDALLMWLRG